MQADGVPRRQDRKLVLGVPLPSVGDRNQRSFPERMGRKVGTCPAVSMMSSWYSEPLCLTILVKVFSIVG